MKRQRLASALFFASAVLLLLPAAVRAQAETTGAITGKVVGQDGHPIAGAEVTAESLDTGAERSATTGDDGSYLFALAQVGNWRVTISAPGMQPHVYTFRVGVGETVPVDATLIAGDTGVEDVITVNAAGLSALETPEIRENLDYRQEVERLPLLTRNINVIANLAPHVAPGGQDPNNPEATNVSVAGAPSMDTIVLLDGAEISTPYFGSGVTVYLEDAIEEVQVLSSAVGARYGRFQGGVINAITKSGSNNYEASLRYEFSKESWNETTPFDEGQSDTLNEVYQATLGGYILKDHLWFFGGYREIPDSGNVSSTRLGAHSFESTTSEDRWQIKLRGAPAPNHTLEASYLEFQSDVANWFFANFPVGDLAATNGQRHDPRDSTTLSYQGILTPSLFLELQATEKDESVIIGGDPNGLDPILNAGGGGGGTAVYANYWWDSTDTSVRDNETQSGIISYNLGGDRAGTHTLEGGVQLVSSTTAGFNQQSATGYNFLSLNPDFIAGTNAAGETLFNVRSFAALRFAPPGGLTRNEQILDNTAVFVQDTIDWGKWRFDVGARWEEYDGAGSLKQHDVNFDKLVPRLAATFNPADRWQVTGSYAQYAARFNDIFAQGLDLFIAPRKQEFYFGPTVLGATAAQVSELTRNDAYWPLLLTYVGPGIQNNYLADDVNMPYSEEWGVSLRRALPKRSGTIVLSYVDRDFEDLMTDFIGGVCDFSNIFTFDHETETCPGSNTTDIIGPTGAVIGQADTLVWANDPRAVRDYQGLAIQIQWRPTPQSNIGGNVTFSSQSANYSGEAPTQPADGGALGTYVRSKTFGGTTFADSAPVLDVDAQRVRLWGGYTFDFDRAGNLDITGLLTGDWTAGSGTSVLASAYSYVDVPTYLGDSGFYALFFDENEPPVSHGYAKLDLAARWDISIFEKFGLWVKATVLNVTNEDELLSAARTGDQNAVVNGVPTFVPAGNCGFDDAPSRNCTGWGAITSENNYARPREYLFTVGLRY
jgi:hypothetical protein